MVGREIDSGAGQVDADLAAAFTTLMIPPGFRAELNDGYIGITPPNGRDHEAVVDRIIRQIYRNDPDGDHVVLRDRGLASPIGRCRPDVMVAGGRAAQPLGMWSDGDGISLVVEVSTKVPDKSRDYHRRRFACAGIPLYVLVDREERIVTAFSGFTADRTDYRDVRRLGFGAKLPLPEPFGFDLDTSELI